MSEGERAILVQGKKTDSKRDPNRSTRKEDNTFSERLGSDPEVDIELRKPSFVHLRERLLSVGEKQRLDQGPLKELTREKAKAKKKARPEKKKEEEETDLALVPSAFVKPTPREAVTKTHAARLLNRNESTLSVFGEKGRVTSVASKYLEHVAVQNSKLFRGKVASARPEEGFTRHRREEYTKTIERRRQEAELAPVPGKKVSFEDESDKEFDI